MILTRALAICFCVVPLALGASAEAKIAAAAKDATASIVIRAGKSDSPNHALAVQFAEAVAVALNGAYTLDVQESQGSVDNVMQAVKGQRDYVFTASPNFIAQARRGAKPFAPDRRYREVRALFPIPAQTVEWVVRRDSTVTTLRGLAGQNFISGAKGSIAERVTTTALQVLGLEHSVQIMDIAAAAAPEALKAKQVSGFAIAGAYPVPALTALAQAMPIRLLSLDPPELAKVMRADDSIAAELVPKGTYPGLAEDTTVLAVPGGAYTTSRMRDATAYAVTKAFWSQHDALATRSPQWQAVGPAALPTLGVKLHPGALRYYREAGIKVPKSLR